jgi:hypothetical protein
MSNTASSLPEVIQEQGPVCPKFPHHPDDQVDIKAIFEEIGRNVATITNGSHPDAVHSPAAEMAGQ